MKLLRVIIIGLLFSQSWAGIYNLSPQLGLLVLYPERAAMLSSPVLQKSSAGMTVETIVRYQGPVSDLYELGMVRCIHKNIAIMSVPIDGIEKLASSSAVQYAELSKADRPLLNASTDSIKAIQARSNYGLAGKGVIVGIIDSGIDWTHEDFIKPDGNTRIKYLLDLSEPGNLYGGALYTEQDINDALHGAGTVYERDYSGHGTHVAGIAAGDGSSNAQLGEYAGVAPEADLVIVKATRDAQSSEFQAADQIISLHFIDSVATVMDQPYVVNMSLGGHWGAHNGTSPVEQMIDDLVGPGIPGKAVVTVVGNDGEVPVHGQVELTTANRNREMTFNISPYTASFGSDNDYLALDIWYDRDQVVSVTLISPDGSVVGPVNRGDVLEENLDDGTVYVWNGYWDVGGGGYARGFDPEIGAFEIYLELSDAQSNHPPADGIWTLRFVGSEGTVDAWIAGNSNQSMFAGFEQGSVETGKVSVPGTAVNVVTVGAYVSKKNWTDLDGNDLTFDLQGKIRNGDVASFSSTGPTRDKRTKPDIMAPGHIIESSYSKDAAPLNGSSIFYGSVDYPNGYISEGGRQALSSGTSMAGPHVAGAIAMIFEQYHDSLAYPSASQVRNMLTRSAFQGRYVGPTPNDYWGYGMLDVLSALQQSSNKETPSNYELMDIRPNPVVMSQTAEIRFELPLENYLQPVEIKVYNILGQHVRTVVSEKMTSGPHTVYWDGRDNIGYVLASGVYFVKFESGSFSEIKKIMLLGKQ